MMHEKREGGALRIPAITFMLLCLLVTTGTAADTTPLPQSIDTPVETIDAIFFHSITCRGCELVKPLVEAVADEYPDIHLQSLELHYNSTNLDLFHETVRNRQIGSYVVPLLIIGNRTFCGEEEIRLSLLPYLRHEKDLIADARDPIAFRDSIIPNHPSQGTYVMGNHTTTGTGSSGRLEVTVLSVLTAAALDSINPCAFAVLFVLLAYLTSLHDRRRMLLVGLTYIGIVFAVYFAAGLALLGFVHSLGISGPVFTIAALVVIGAGLVQILDLLLKRNGFSLSIPDAAKEKISRYIRRATIPSAVLLGALVSLVELPCTGGIYLAILGLMSDRMTFAEGLPYLILYNIIFVLPLTIALAVVYSGTSPDRVETLRYRYNRPVRLIIALFMIGIGMAMLLGII
ncbi:cytochrome c biogenesis protein CcdA [Methanocalculus taiwanensis]|uniref:Cytochrome c biogenesis protein CcdA n=1 Tax=Methanocalculus taiwanensis TaxID=106207 RepID=A0ABD4TGR9_9EURY|nr:cytochrome c biogenesis CcdA family protein [Methanocalculus taiwanensis]MCQ1537399.1 cytochrome c biogenesis protein CcdA [Methanocalculus taiwanensis]